MTSRTADQQEARQAYAEGRDMDVTVKPAAHPVGTTLEVLDLFYNTPARRKFMRTEKTEFGHIDEIIRRIALARFDVTLNLSHNGKVMRQYRAVAEGGQKASVGRHLRHTVSGKALAIGGSMAIWPCAAGLPIRTPAAPRSQKSSIATSTAA